jgi:ATP:ADP antiporter, AAA family
VSFFAMRKGERRDVWAAFLTLFALIASHSLLETARDALFLAKIPSSNLPWVFLAIAALSLASVKLNARATRGMTPQRALCSVTIVASLVTLGFFVLARELGSWGLYALYVWSGLLATLVLAHFWDLVGARFTITQAKRLYGFIGAGSVLGAIAGSGAASLLSRGAPPQRLVLLSAVGLFVAGLIPLSFEGRTNPQLAEEEPLELRETLKYVAKDRYAARVVAALFLATVCLTISDYVFKSAIAAVVPKAQLGQFLGTVYFAVNVLSLICQLGLVGFILRRMSLGAALGVLPALLVLGGLGVAVSAGLVAVIALKASDGALRYSLHRTTAELMVLPFGDEGRQRVKTFVDLIGQRGGQVLASLVLLGLSAAGAPPRAVALGLVFLSVLWLAGALSLREPYVAVFRARLKAGRQHQLAEFPELDVSSLETLLSAFESSNDREVLAALNVLEREHKTQLIPALLLHHPSEPIVLQVLAILARSGRKAAVPTIDRITEHPSPAVRAAAIAARSVLGHDAEQLRQRLTDEASPEVRAAITVNLIVSGEFEDATRARHSDELLRSGSSAAKQAFAEAIGRRAAAGFDDVLIALVKTPEIEVRRCSVVAMGNVRSPRLLLHLIDALLDEATRSEAEQALANYGDAAFDALRERFEDTRTEQTVRWRIPAAMATCAPERALAGLTEWLPKEPDGAVRFGILVVMERLIRLHPSLSVDRTALMRSVAETLARAYRFLDARLLLVRGAEQDPKRKTLAYELLHDLLRDKEANARGRLFRLLSLIYPSEDFGQIYRSLSVSKNHRATSVELIESILREPVRSAVLGLIDDCADDLRLSRAGKYHHPRVLDYPTLLDQLSHGESDAVRQVARHHAAELGLTFNQKAVQAA